MPTGMAEAGLALGLMMAACATSWADGFKAIAKELSRAAKEARIARVAVLPFVAGDGSEAKEGWNISEKLITQLVRQGKLQAVERSLLRKLMAEHYLGGTGMLNSASLRKVGKIFAVDAVVTGSFITLGSETVVNARLIDVETGVIFAAAERKVEREWLGDDSWSVPVPELAVAPPPLVFDPPQDTHDSISESACQDAAQRVDQLEGQILDLKARYWALQLKKGVSLAGLKSNPGSTITDPILKKVFYDRMKDWYAQDRIPELTPTEIKRFTWLDEKAYSLFHDCEL